MCETVLGLFFCGTEISTVERNQYSRWSESKQSSVSQSTKFFCSDITHEDGE
jgi:hypothetical protein